MLTYNDWCKAMGDLTSIVKACTGYSDLIPSHINKSHINSLVRSCLEELDIVIKGCPKPNKKVVINVRSRILFGWHETEHVKTKPKLPINASAHYRNVVYCTELLKLVYKLRMTYPKATISIHCIPKDKDNNL